jgi:RNA polymerase sigma-70 factor (ECF subfamily)
VAEELAQDVFVEAFRRWTALQDYERPEAWARRAVLNRAISTRRRYLVELRLLVRLGNERADVNPPFTDTSAELWREVRRLPRRQAQVLALLYGEDRTVEEVATILNCSPDTVRTHLRRGRLALADRLSVEGENETSGTQ